MIPPSLCADLHRSPRVGEFLQDLNLGHNRFSRLPEELSLLINLRKLNLEHNLLNEFPKCVLSFYRLEELRVRHNRIKDLPWGMNRLKRLKVLTLDSNEIDYLPNTIGKLKFLTEFSLIPNPLGTVNDEDVLLACHYRNTNFVLRYLLIQQIPKNYPYFEEIRTSLARKEEKKNEFSEEQNSLRKVLKHPDGYAALEVLMTKEHSMENLLFWKNISDFSNNYSSDKEITTTELIEDAKKIFNEFIAADSTYTVNLPADITSELRKNFTDPFIFPKGINQWIFDKANKAVFILMSRDTYRRFKLTSDGSALVKNITEKSTKRKVLIEN